VSSDIAWMARNARNAALMSTAWTLAVDSTATSTERAKVARISKSPSRPRRTDLSRCTAISPPRCPVTDARTTPVRPEPASVLIYIKFHFRRTTYLARASVACTRGGSVDPDQRRPRPFVVTPAHDAFPLVALVILLTGCATGGVRTLPAPVAGSPIAEGMARVSASRTSDLLFLALGADIAVNDQSAGSIFRGESTSAEVPAGMTTVAVSAWGSPGDSRRVSWMVVGSVLSVSPVSERPMMCLGDERLEHLAF
jgi:hypothetical protein